MNRENEYNNNNKVALVLEGGAGLYTAGVLDVFMKNDIKIENKNI